MFEETNAKLMKKSIIYGGIAAVIIFCMGFLTMYILWNNGEYPRELPGLFYYRAATIGDGICLPILIFAMVAFCQYNQDIEVHNKKICRIMSLCAMYISGIIQMLWLVSDDTKLNWSLPIKHCFNVAGWYHSIFFILMFGVIIYVLVCMWFKIRSRVRAYCFFEMLMLIVFSGAGSNFIFLFLLDDYGEKMSAYIMLPVTALVIIAALMLLLKSRLKDFNRISRFSFLTGVSCSCGIVLLLFSEINGDLLLALGGTLCIIFLLECRSYKISQLVALILILVSGYLGLFYVMTAIESWREGVCLSAFVLIVTFLIEKQREQKYVCHYMGGIIVVIYILITKMMIENVGIFKDLKGYNVIVNAMFYLSLNIIFSKEIKYVFNTVVEGERKINDGAIDKKEFKSIKAKAYFVIIIGVATIIICLCHWVIDIAKAHDAQLLIGQLNSDMMAYVSCVLLAFMLILFLLSRKKIKSQFIKISSILLASAIYLTLIVIIVLCISEINPFNMNSGIQWILFACSLFASLGTPVLVSYGFVMNLTYLRKNENDNYIKCMSAIMFISNFLIMVFSIILLLFNCSWVSMGVVIGGAIIALEYVPAINAEILYKEGESNREIHVVPNTAVGGVCQDGFSSMFVYLFEICLPCIYISVINGCDFSLVLSTGSMIISVMFVIAFFLENNVKHVTEQKKVLEKYPEEKELWEALRLCLKRQNYITVFTMLPYVMMGVIAYILKSMCKNISPKDSIENLKAKYIGK